MTPQLENYWRRYRRAIDTGDFDSALEFAKDGYRTHLERGDMKHAGIWQRALATVLFLQGQYPAACDEALGSFKIQPDLYEQALSLVAVGNVQTYAGRYRSAFHYFSRASKLADQFREDIYLWTHLLGARAIAFRRTGRLDKAIIDWEGSVELLRRNGHLWRAAAYMNNIGFLLLSGGHLREAEQRLLEAIELVETDPHAHTEAIIYDSLGCVYAKMEQYSQSERFLRLSVRLFQKLGDRSQLAGSLIHLSDLYQRMSHYDDAHDYALRALDTAVETKNEPIIAEARERLKSVTVGLIRQEQSISIKPTREPVLSTGKVIRFQDYRGSPGKS